MEDENYKKAKDIFLEKYQKEIVPALMPYEQERKKRNKSSKICAWITLTLTVLYFAAVVIILFFFMDSPAANFLHFLAGKDGGLILPVGFGIFMVGGLITTSFTAGFMRTLKCKVMPVICSCFENLKWIEIPKIDAKFYRQCCFILKDYTHARFDDVFCGSYKNTDYEIIEAYYDIVHRSGKSSYTEILFDGVILKVKLNKKFHSHTIIAPDSLTHHSPSSHLKHTTLEDTVFEKKYDVFTNDEIEARYLITTSFMERLSNCKVDRCVFYQGEIIIGLPTEKNLFEPVKINKPLTSYTQILSMFDQIYSVIDLIDYFKLNEKTGL